LIRTLDIARDDRAPMIARRALDDIRDDLGAEALEDARLLVTELVANSVRHGRGERVHLILEQPAPGRLRCEVVDDGTGFLPLARPVGTRDDGGWGLFLVERLADSWGVFEGSTHVWFELSSRH
jgi:anti-sigma regulatory factor (Ser/Thr protein kinase)